MNYEEPDPTPVDQVPLGGQFIIFDCADESVARAFHKDRSAGRSDALLVIGKRGEWYVWIWTNPAWPIAGRRP